MSTSIESKLDYARAVINHSARDAVTEDILMSLFNSWLKGKPDEESRALKDGMEMYFRHLKAIIDKAENIETE